MNRLMRCSTCNGEGFIQDRRDTNRDEEETQEPSLLDVKAYPTLNGLFGRYEEEEPPKYIKKDWKRYSFPETSRYACKIDYNEEAKELIADLRKLGKSSGFTIRVRGSGPRAPQHRKDGKDLRRIYDQSLPLKYSEQVRIYIDHK